MKDTTVSIVPQKERARAVRSFVYSSRTLNVRTKGAAGGRGDACPPFLLSFLFLVSFLACRVFVFDHCWKAWVLLNSSHYLVNQS